MIQIFFGKEKLCGLEQFIDDAVRASANGRADDYRMSQRLI
jgi:hypothetical protein